ncbi:DNA topoisomerase IB [Variovorax sp. LT2P21]|uniref:DNA topoisomerase IB n=1 Tax=Variovorax sp. LT2P21 TaxID=3443731 RepID=UPI003F452711
MPRTKTPHPARLANGLVYVNPDMPGLRRFRQGEHFRYKDATGAWVRDPDEIARIRSLAIPPAYTDVWICPLPNGHLQATGLDARGRKQYRYHPDWRVLKDESKFERLEAFGSALPRIRARVVRDLGDGGAREALGRERVLATLVRLLDTTFLRVGNEAYASTNGSYGLTTLRNKHVAVRGASLKLRFRGKSGVMHETAVDDPRVAKVVRACQQLPGQDLFQYEDADGTPRRLSSTDVNDYLREAAGENFTAKDFRTWHGTVQALELTRLACDSRDTGDSGDRGDATPSMRFSAKEIIAAVAKQLGNTPAVCKKAYVHPAVLALGTTLAQDAGTMTDVWQKIAGQARSARRLYAAEARLLAFLKTHRRELVRESTAAGATAARQPRRTQPGASGKRTRSCSMVST